MLIEFTVSNFKCIKEPATLSMEASRDDALTSNVYSADKAAGRDLLTCAVVYGANASGKSTLLEALRVMCRGVITSALYDQPGTLAVPFLLDSQTADSPSVMRTTLSIDGQVYEYGFSATSKQVVAEHLHGYRNNRKRVLYERTVDGQGTSAFKFGSSWKGHAKRTGEMTRKDSLFLTVAARFNHALAKTLLHWFADQVRVLNPSPVGSGEELFTMSQSREDPRMQENVTTLLRKADLQIEDFVVHEEDLEEPDDPRLRKFIRAFGIGSNSDSGKLKILGVKTTHKAIDKNGAETRVTFGIRDESSGTQKFFALAGPLLAVMDNGSVLIADELGRSLHPLLTRAVVEMFHNPSINKKGAQLLFTSHDTSLLTGEPLFRRDQVWIADKNAEGAASLVSLWDYKVRKGDNLMKGYLAGRYGGVPFVEGLSQAGEPAIE